VKIAIRLAAAIWVAALGIMGGFAYVQIRDERHRLLAELERRSALLAETLKESVEPAARRGSSAGIRRVVKKFGRSDRRIGVYDAFGSAIAAAPAVPVPASLPEITEVIAKAAVGKGLRLLDGRKTYFYATPHEDKDVVLGALAVFLDAAQVDAAENTLPRETSLVESGVEFGESNWDGIEQHQRAQPDASPGNPSRSEFLP
jgi:hypothetical protein